MFEVVPGKQSIGVFFYWPTLMSSSVKFSHEAGAGQRAGGFHGGF